MGRTWPICSLLLLAACGSQPKREEVLFAELAAALPGSYDNMAQSRQDPGHPALRLVIVPVQAGMLGEQVFYVQEMAADDARRVFSQRMFVLNPVPDTQKVLLGQADLTEPVRWRDGHLNRDLFKGMLPEDVRVRAGCELLIERADKGFTGKGGSNCRVPAAGTGETLKVELQLNLTADGLELLEQQRDAAGVLVPAGGSDPWHRFARRADAPF